MENEDRQFTPHPSVVAARKALAARPPVTLEQVRIQIKAADEWRKRQSDGNKSRPRPER
jgi:hypothetical protein